MTAKALRHLCEERDMYTTPSLNTVLFFASVGWTRIAGLDAFTLTQTVHLQSNGLRRIEGLEALKQLRNLNLQQNLIERIENMGSLTQLRRIDLSNNLLTSLAGIESLHALEVLDVSKNEIAGSDAMQHVLCCPSLVDLDLSSNALAEGEGEGVVAVLRQLPELNVLRLQGNPFVRGFRHYRRQVILACESLTYFDAAPLFADDRRRALVWQKAFEAGGLAAANAAEVAELRAIGKEKDLASESNHSWMSGFSRPEAAEASLGRTTSTAAPPRPPPARPVERDLLSANTKRLVEAAGGTVASMGRGIDLSTFDHTNYNFYHQTPISLQPPPGTAPTTQKTGPDSSAVNPAAAPVRTDTADTEPSSAHTDFSELD